jgi:hypothetical protein
LPKEGKTFDFKKHKTWSKKGIREQWDFLTDKGFNDIVVIGCVEDDLIRNDACVQLRDPEKYAYALKQRLIMRFIKGNIVHFMFISFVAITWFVKLCEAKFN